MTIHDGYFAVYITCHKSSIPVNTHTHTQAIRTDQHQKSRCQNNSIQSTERLQSLSHRWRHYWKMKRHRHVQHVKLLVLTFAWQCNDEACVAFSIIAMCHLYLSRLFAVLHTCDRLRLFVCFDLAWMQIRAGKQTFCSWRGWSKVQRSPGRPDH